MAEAKTKPTKISPKAFLAKVEDKQQRADALAVMQLMKKITGEKPTMWGPSIIGFGKYHYKYASGHEGDCCITGLSPRKAALTLYVMGAIQGNPDLLKKLGKHKASKGCLYIKKLEDVDQAVLTKLIKASVEWVKKQYPDK
ncbi:MAG: DUF1801 domain-containing protein [Gemmataceae bacterium]